MFTFEAASIVHKLFNISIMKSEQLFWLSMLVFLYVIFLKSIFVVLFISRGLETVTTFFELSKDVYKRQPLSNNYKRRVQENQF